MNHKNRHLFPASTGFSLLVVFSLIITITLISATSPPAGQNDDMDHTPMNPTASEIIKEVGLTNPELAAELHKIYEATRRFENVEAALEEGYIRDPMDMCELASAAGLPSFMGAMGIHYFRPDLLGITETEPRVNGVGLHTDFRNPAILIYEPQTDGSMELVAVENLVFHEAWHAAGNENPPNFMGYEYFYMINNPLTDFDEAHMFEPHYDLHIWLYRKNPHGLLLPFNPAVSCDNHMADRHMD